MRRYWLTGKQLRRGGTVQRVLSGGWDTSRLMLEGASRAASATPDGGFTIEDLRAEVETLMAEHGILFTGFTSHSSRYRSHAERVVHGRFGDMRRGGYFSTIPTECTDVGSPRVYDNGNNVAARLDALFGQSSFVYPEAFQDDYKGDSTCNR